TEEQSCQKGIAQSVPCETFCPAHVDVPGYIALVAEGRSAEAVALIRKDNPFPTACGYVCEHPCEKRCRRTL
ncbi:MAG TPA: glutamate synthase, partial [Sutterella wadsworthensis]|nr:glutamate synthase [Sutterella wadsworthensis]